MQPVKRQSKSRSGASLKKAPAEHTDNSQFAAFIRRFREDMGYKTQQALASKLGVDRSAVSAWESPKGYRPSAETLIKIANLADYPLCSQLYSEAGFDNTKLWHELRRQAAPGAGLVSVPFLELPDPFDHPERVWQIGPPLSDLADQSNIACIRVGGSVPPLFPFTKGQIAFVDRSKLDWWDLIDTGSLVAVHFSRYPERLGIDRETEMRFSLGVPPPTPRSAGHQRRFSKRINSDKPLTYLTPDSDGMIGLEAIHVGWLAIDRPNDPGFRMLGDRDKWRVLPAAADPWRVVLRGADVTGVSSAGLVQLTQWETEQSWQDRPQIRPKHVTLIGKVAACLSSSFGYKAQRGKEE